MTSTLDYKQVSNLLQGRKVSTLPNDVKLDDFGKNKVILRKGGSLNAKLEQTKLWTLDPISFTAGSFTSNQITFRLQPKFMKHIHAVFLELVCSETGGSNSVTPLCAPFLINRIEIGLNSQPSPFNTVYAENLYTSWQFFNQEAQINLFGGNSLNMSYTTYASETAIAAGSSATYVLPIPMSLLDKINPDLLKSDIIVNVFPAVSPIASGTGTLQLTNMRFRFHSTENPLADTAISGLYSKYSSIIDYCDTVNIPYTGTFQANTTVEIPLQGVNGLCPAFFFVLRSSKAAAAGAIRTFALLGGSSPSTGSIDLVNQNKVTMLGSGPITPQYCRHQLPAMHSKGYQSSVVGVYWVFLNSDPASSIVNGNINGGVGLCGSEFLRLTPGTGFVTGTYTVDIYLYMHNSLVLSHGQFKRLQ